MKRFSPGPLTCRQRHYIAKASRILDGTPVPLSSTQIARGDWASVIGLVRRGLMEERDNGFFYLTDNGRKVAEAIEALAA